MNFKNLQLYSLPAPWEFCPEKLEAALSRFAFVPIESSEVKRQGWAAPRESGPLAHIRNRQILIRLTEATKLLPASVIHQATKAKAAELEEAQGFAPGRKAMKELKERMADELLPRAFPIQQDVLAWIDPVNGWLAVNASSATKADDTIKLLWRSIDRFPVESLRVQRTPAAAMTAWLEMDEAPHNFTIDMDATMRATGDSKAAISYKSHSLEPDDLRRHIAAGKQCERLAMTWDSKISFVLTSNLSIKSIKILDLLKENDIAQAGCEERFDNNMVLLTGELSKMFSDLVDALGGRAVSN